MDRRKFIRSMGQMTIVTGIIAMSGYLVFREKQGDACDFDFLCHDCKKLKSCKLPEAKLTIGEIAKQ